MKFFSKFNYFLAFHASKSATRTCYMYNIIIKYNAENENSDLISIL